MVRKVPLGPVALEQRLPLLRAVACLGSDHGPQLPTSSKEKLAGVLPLEEGEEH